MYPRPLRKLVSDRVGGKLRSYNSCLNWGLLQCRYSLPTLHEDQRHESVLQLHLTLENMTYACLCCSLLPLVHALAVQSGPTTRNRKSKLAGDGDRFGDYLCPFALCKWTQSIYKHQIHQT